MICSSLAGEDIDRDFVEALDGSDVGAETGDLPLPDNSGAVVNNVEGVHLWESRGVDETVDELLLGRKGDRIDLLEMLAFLFLWI